MLQQPTITQDFSSVDTFFSEKIEQKQLAGAVALVVRHGKTVYFRPHGYMDIEKRVPMSGDVIIPIASMTKIMTSIGILILHEQGKLRLDDPIGQYLRQFRNMKVFAAPGSAKTVDAITEPTVRQFLSHTAGLAYSWGDTPTDSLYLAAGFREWNKPLKEFVDSIAAIPLAFQPGTDWMYSYSHDVLGYLIEKISGMPLDRFLREKLLGPLGMEDTDFYIQKEKSDRQSSLYLYEEGQLRQVDSRYSSIYDTAPTALSGGGGWYDAYGGAVSTAADYLRLTQWLLHYKEEVHPEILSPGSIEEMIACHTDGISDFRYGLGVGLKQGNDGKTEEIYWAGAPYNTHFWIDYPRKEIGILLTNTAPFGHLDIMNAFRNAVNGCR